MLRLFFCLDLDRGEKIPLQSGKAKKKPTGGGQGQKKSPLEVGFKSIFLEENRGDR
jgi:hypothetical protein